MLECQVPTASWATCRELPPVPAGGPYPVDENSNPSTSTPLRVRAQLPEVTTLFPITPSAGGAAHNVERKKKQKIKPKNNPNRWRNISGPRLRLPDGFRKNDFNECPIKKIQTAAAKSITIKNAISMPFLVVFLIFTAV